MRRVVEAGFLVAVALAVLAFGGTAPQFFSVTQGIVLFLGILELASAQDFPATSPRFPITVPFLLITLVLLQITPLPIFLAPAFGVSVPDQPSHSYFTIKIGRAHV